MNLSILKSFKKKKHGIRFTSWHINVAYRLLKYHSLYVMGDMFEPYGEHILQSQYDCILKERKLWPLDLI